MTPCSGVIDDGLSDHTVLVSLVELFLAVSRSTKTGGRGGAVRCGLGSVRFASGSHSITVIHSYLSFGRTALKTYSTLPFLQSASSRAPHGYLLGLVVFSRGRYFPIPNRIPENAQAFHARLIQCFSSHQPSHSSLVTPSSCRAFFLVISAPACRYLTRPEAVARGKVPRSG